MIIENGCAETTLIAENETDKRLLLELWNLINNKSDKIRFENNEGILSLLSD